MFLKCLLVVLMIWIDKCIEYNNNNDQKWTSDIDV